MDKENEDIKKEEIKVEQPEVEEQEKELELEPEAECLTKEQTAEPYDEERPIARLEFSLILYSSLSSFFFFSPRRISELNIVEKVKSVPPYSSLFLFSHTNK